MSDNNFLVPQTKSESMPAKKLPCPFSPASMLQPSHLQPPPMFGPRGTTIPPKHLAPYAHFKVNRSQPRSTAPRPTFNNHHRPRDSAPRYHHNNNRMRGPQRTQTQTREFWCEPCDRDFRSQDLLQEHNSQHQKCGIDGCKFVGHEMIVSKHIQMQHSSGLYERLKNLETPEDIMKWREERRKRYPTKANIELRQQIQEERNKRGEKLNDSKARFGRQSDRRRCNNKSTDGNRPATEANVEGNSANKNREGKKKRRRTNKKIVKIVEQRDNEDNRNESVSNNGLPMFCGTSQLKNYKKRKEIQPKNALSSLMGAYDTDSNSSESSDEMESPATIFTSTDKSETNSVAESRSSGSEVALAVDTTRKDVSCKDSNNVCESVIPENSVETIDTNNDLDELPIEERIPDNDMEELQSEDRISSEDMEDLPSEERILKTDSVSDSFPPTEDAKVDNRRKTKKILDKRLSRKPTVMDLSKKYRNQNTMLEKLLQNEIRHERNVLLQCVRHVVKEKFFGIGQKPA